MVLDELAQGAVLMVALVFVGVVHVIHILDLKCQSCKGKTTFVNRHDTVTTS
jgi:hypothetical protein